MDPGTLKRAADVARIRLDDGELIRFKEEIDGLMDILGTLGDAPECDSFCFDPIGVSDALREDIPKVDGNVDEMLRGMSTYDGYVRGPKIV
ncbi:MAG: Asp-tRNA(Asn)/Glu-tRNA(Gln) amidotransferase GatCAB subunit C [Methanomassiliicoccaceae archaeon]|jgi:aspartyl-tRNA(Asn)/glutamyl-tRNA(Gln) amidotransferase subunit C|nr:Asp-tRNA(Asn)/Glu-tRNA(Gln) amidotransferase GatCAB subunit C [Methanomassiliicoccaceae archaeon]